MTTPETTMEAILASLQAARNAGPSVEHKVNRSLVALMLLEHRRAASPVDPERLRRFRAESAEVLLEFPNVIGCYVHLTLIDAEGASEDEWPLLCERRSVIQVLLDHYGDTPLAGMLDTELLADLDVELRRVGKEQGPVPADDVPALPASHWWWQYPPAD